MIVRRSATHWLVPLQMIAPTQPMPAHTVRCVTPDAAWWAIERSNGWMQYDEVAGTVLLRDPAASMTVDGRTRITPDTESRISSIGINQQVTARYSGMGMRWSGLSELYAWRNGWYAQTSLGMSGGQAVRYETFALNENQESAVALRVGDGITTPTALGESARYAGIGWGVDRSLQPSDFGPVLPNLRGSDVVSGPVALFVNDQLQFQQSLDGRNYDLRNMPAQRGFNTYSVRTVDAQGNTVQVTRELYVPQNLLPKDALAWRVDGGIQRKRYGQESFAYGGPVASAYVAYGATDDTTLTANALALRDGQTASVEWDQRIGPMVGGQLALIMSRSLGESGTGARMRLEGGTRNWRFFTEMLRSPGGLPSLTGVLAPLTSQSLVSASWMPAKNWSLAVSAVRNVRVGQPVEEVASVTASVSPGAIGFPILLGYTHLRMGNDSPRKQLTVSAFVPLEPKTRTRSLFGNVTSTDHAQITRAQYSESDATGGNGPTWSVGADHDSRTGQTGADAQWFQQLPTAEVIASARTSGNYNEASMTVRSGLLWASNSLFVTRPITGSFALVSTGVEDMAVMHENRVAGTTNSKGIALVPGLRAFEPNKISLDPTDWPMHVTVRDTARFPVPPRGGGVFVSFVVNANVWPTQTMVRLPVRGGGTYPAGTAVWASDAPQRTTVIDSEGKVWLGDLLPARMVTLQKGAELCEYVLPLPEETTDSAQLVSCRPAP